MEVMSRFTEENTPSLANFTTRVYTITHLVNAWGVIGDATPKGWDGDTLMDFDPRYLKIIFYDCEVKSWLFKFRLNLDWEQISECGNNLSLENWNNIPIAAQTYYLALQDFTGLNYTIKKL
jgi:hypothetical protein